MFAHAASQPQAKSERDFCRSQGARQRLPFDQPSPSEVLLTGFVPLTHFSLFYLFLRLSYSVFLSLFFIAFLSFSLHRN
jgi:hypothetical protein